MASGYQLAEEEEIYHLEECAKGEEMKMVNNLNKELRSLDDDKYAWLMATPAKWIWTCRKLTILFNNFVLSKNVRVKIWVGYCWLNQFTIPDSIPTPRISDGRITGVLHLGCRPGLP